MKTVFWGGLYVLSFIAHGSWIVVAIPMSNLIGTGLVWTLVIIVIAWVVVVVLSSGCPFAYIHESIAMKAGWRKERTYKYEDSIVFRFIISPVQRILKKRC